jgi:hypothetical protein
MRARGLTRWVKSQWQVQPVPSPGLARNIRLLSRLPTESSRPIRRSCPPFPARDRQKGPRQNRRLRADKTNAPRRCARGPGGVRGPHSAWYRWNVLVVLACAYWASERQGHAQDKLEPTRATAHESHSWRAVGMGGGGAMFTPAISPADPRLILLSCDMRTPSSMSALSGAASGAGRRTEQRRTNPGNRARALAWTTFFCLSHGVGTTSGLASASSTTSAACKCSHRLRRTQ